MPQLRVAALDGTRRTLTDYPTKPDKHLRQPEKANIFRTMHVADTRSNIRNRHDSLHGELGSRGTQSELRFLRLALLRTGELTTLYPYSCQDKSTPLGAMAAMYRPNVRTQNVRGGTPRGISPG
jgi:hypothetical protein